MYAWLPWIYMCTVCMCSCWIRDINEACMTYDTHILTCNIRLIVLHNSTMHVKELTNTKWRKRKWHQVTTLYILWLSCYIVIIFTAKSTLEIVKFNVALMVIRYGITGALMYASKRYSFVSLKSFESFTFAVNVATIFHPLTRYNFH